MPILTGITLKCDFCGKSHGPEANPRPAGWMRLQRAGELAEKKEPENVLCPQCLSAVRVQGDKIERLQEETRRAIGRL